MTVVSGRNTTSGSRARSRACGLAVALFLAAVSGAAGQTVSSGGIVGTVVDEAGAPVPGVVVSITNRVNGRLEIVRSNRAGEFAVDLLAPGLYDVLVERLGYGPRRLEDLVVEAGLRRYVRLRLEPATGEIEVRRSTAPRITRAAAQTGPDRWYLGLDGPAALPFDDRGLGSLLRSASVAGERSEIEGLPASLRGVVLDGVPLTRRMRAFDALSREIALPLAYFARVGLATVDADVEYPGSPAGHLRAHTRRGGSIRGLEAFGHFGSDALAAQSGEAAAFTSFQAGAVLQGAVVQDTTSFVVGAEILRSRTPYAAFWTEDAEASRFALAAQQTYGSSLDGFTGPGTAAIDRESAFARLDMRLGSSSTLSVRGFFASIPEPEPVAPWTESAVGSAITPRIREIVAAATLTTRSEDWVGQFDLGFETSRGEERSPDARRDAVPATTVVAAGRSIGSSEKPMFLSEMRSFYGRATAHFQSGTHWRKVGVAVTLPWFRAPTIPGEAGSFWFADTPDFENGFGYYTGLDGPDYTREFTMRRVALFAQDTWRPRPDVEVLVGARLSSLHQDDTTKVNSDPGWARLTGLSNRTVPERQIDFEPRLVVTWSNAGGQAWLARAGVMVDAELADPNAIGEVISSHGRFQVRSGLGSIGRWPQLPREPTAPQRGRTLSLLGPEFRGPRTSRAFASITRAFGSEGTVTVGLTYRKTEFLPQRTDLNALPVVTAEDQSGRPLFGQLEKRRGLLTAVPLSNRRFGGYQQVWGLQSTGQSRYLGFSTTAEGSLAGRLRVHASYTYSKTEDDWLTGRGGDPFTQLAPWPDTLLARPWLDGRSDFDVPHRAIAGAELRLPGAGSPRVAALFRYQSGYPFTPGFRPGVDANADGSPHNDPAFIDESVPGAADLIAQWPCLSQDRGNFATRNACRAPAMLGLDARFSLTFRRGSGHTASLVVDALDLLASDEGTVDNAPFLVDPAADLSVSPDGGTVRVPLLANEGFGRLLTRFSPQPQLRFGLRVDF